MDEFHDKSKADATYRSKDPIKNLKIKVTVKRLSSSTIAFPTEEATNEPLTDVPFSTNQFGQTILDEETFVVHWQQKLFSQREMEYYGFEPHCTSTADYKYHAEVEKIIKSGGRKNKRLFTYVKNDRFSISEQQQYMHMTTSENETPSILMNRIMSVRRRKNAEAQAAPPAWELSKAGNTTGLKLVEAEPTEEFKDNHHLINTPVHTFMLMVDLSPEGQLGSAEFERPLCIIEYDDNCVMRVFPDFSKLPYRIKEGALSRDVWEYTIEHASSPVSKMELKRETKMISELYQKHQAYLSSLVGNDFEELTDKLFRLITYGEIVSAESFEFDDLHVEYFIDLPSMWSCDPSQLLSGCTHTSSTVLLENKETAYFSHPFNYQMFLNFSQDDSTEFEWPKIFLHVISSDSWGRRRTEGYGYFTLPTKPGLHDIVVQCWRPIGNAGYGTVQAQLRRYFIGGSPELEDVTYAAVPSGFEGKILSKYGVRCTATGSVQVRVNCMQQCKAFKDEVSTTISRKKWQTALQLAKGRATQHAIHGVMEAYQRARKRMQLARETVPSQIRLAAVKQAQDKLKNTSYEDKVKLALSKTKIE